MNRFLLVLLFFIFLTAPALADYGSNAKLRIRTAVASADVADPTTSSTFSPTQGSSYVEISVNFNSSATACTIQPWFKEDNVTDGSGNAVTAYVSSGATIDLTKTSGSTVIIPGVNGRKLYIKVTSITGAGSIDIDLAPSRIGPGVNAI
ncbi:MAG: hypothetical protein AB1706_17095 [Pseudomonadota bacterium]